MRLTASAAVAMVKACCLRPASKVSLPDDFCIGSAPAIAGTMKGVGAGSMRFTPVPDRPSSASPRDGPSPGPEKTSGSDGDGLRAINVAVRQFQGQTARQRPAGDSAARGIAAHQVHLDAFDDSLPARRLIVVVYDIPYQPALFAQRRLNLQTALANEVLAVCVCERPGYRTSNLTGRDLSGRNGSPIWNRCSPPCIGHVTG